MQSHIGTSFSDQDVKDYLWSTLKSGQVVPGYGHAVLRKPDPRFEALMKFASSRPEIAKDPVFRLVKKNSEIAPGVLKEHGKVVHPYQRPSQSFSIVPTTELTATSDQEPIPKRRLLLRCALPPLRLPRNTLLHRHVRRLARTGPASAVDMGSGAGFADRAAQKY